MAARIIPATAGRETARSIIAELCREIRVARLDRDVSQDDLARAAGVTRGWVSRVERGLVDDLSIELAAVLLAAVGLRLSARAFPDASPIRDAAHAKLLHRVRIGLHPSLRWATEVPLPREGDLRAWDAMIRGDGWLVGVEAETRPRDLQALQRRLALKLRDGGVDRLLLVLLDSRHNRALLRAYAGDLAGLFPLPGPRALELLRAGAVPDGNALVLA